MNGWQVIFLWLGGHLENPSRGFEVRNRWKRGIPADRPENLQLPDITYLRPIRTALNLKATKVMIRG